MSILKPRLVAKAVTNSAESVLEDFRDRTIVDEENVTDRLAQAIKGALDGKRFGGLRWRARTLRTGKGKAAEEKRHGADLLGVLEIAIPGLEVKKGFLAQAKIIEPGKPLTPKAWSTFKGQCAQMAERTDESFGLIYSRQRGILLIPTATILSMDRKSVFEVDSHTLHGFFEDHVSCKIGDRKLSAPSIEVLDRLLATKAPASDLSDASTILSMKVSNA